MEAQLIIALAGSVIGGLLAILFTLISWTGSRTVNKLDELDRKVDNLTVDVLSRVNRVDSRVAVLEVLVGSKL